MLYAANDALAAVKIFIALIDKKLPGDPSRWRQQQHDSNEFWSRVVSVCQGIIDVGASTKPVKVSSSTSVSVRVCVPACVYFHECMRACMHVCACMHVRASVCMCAITSVCVQLHACMYAE